MKFIMHKIQLSMRSRSILAVDRVFSLAVLAVRKLETGSKRRVFGDQKKEDGEGTE